MSEVINPNVVKLAKFQKQLGNNVAQCLTCERRCKISEGKVGFCKTQINNHGQIYSIVFGLLPVISINPIEKKPLFHFYPGTKALTVGTYGCNFSCFWCQNHHLSKRDPLKAIEFTNSNNFITPTKFIQIALKKKCEGTSISFNEPTLLFEYSLEVFKLAKQNGLYNTYVTNGYMTEKVLMSLKEAGLDAMNIDIKGGRDMVQKYCGVNNEVVWRNAGIAIDIGVHIEITTLLIEDFNTDKRIIENIATRVFTDLGEYTPFHITRFHPDYESFKYGLTKPTPTKSLFDAYDIAKKIGLKYVYLGNVGKTDFENTVCPKCSRTVITRSIMGVSEKNVDSKGNCEYCGFHICEV